MLQSSFRGHRASRALLNEEIEERVALAEAVESLGEAEGEEEELEEEEKLQFLVSEMSVIFQSEVDVSF